MADSGAAADSTCPRCGGGFHCGVADAGPCACFGLKLSPALLARLRSDYSRCLCEGCLRALAAEKPVNPCYTDPVPTMAARRN